MALNADIQVLTQPGSTGQQTYSLAAGFDPKAILIWATPHTADGTTATGLAFSVGFATFRGGSVQQRYATLRSAHASGTADDSRGQGSNACCVLHTQSANAATRDLEIDFVSWGTGDQVVLDWVNLHTTASIRVFMLVLGGSDISDALAGSYTPSASSTTQDFTVASGFGQPDLLFTSGANGLNTDSAVSPEFYFGFGKKGEAGRGFSWSEVDANTASQTAQTQRSDRILNQLVATGSATYTRNSQAALDTTTANWPTDGFRLIFDANPVGSYAQQFLALRTTAQIATGSNSSPTAGGAALTQDNAAGFAPKLGFAFSWMLPTNAAALTADASQAGFTVGGYDGSTEVNAGGWADDAALTMSTKVWNTASKALASWQAGILRHEADGSFSGNNYRLVWNTSYTTASEYQWLVLGDSIPGDVTITAVAATSSWQASAPTVRVPWTLAAASSGLQAAAPTVLIYRAIVATAAVQGWQASAPTVTVRAVAAAAAESWAASAPTIRVPYAGAIATLGMSAATPAVNVPVAPPAAIVGWGAATPSVAVRALATPGTSGAAAAPPAITGAVAPPPGLVGFAAATPSVRVSIVGTQGTIGASATTPGVYAAVQGVAATSGWSAAPPSARAAVGPPAALLGLSAASPDVTVNVGPVVIVAAAAVASFAAAVPSVLVTGPVAIDAPPAVASFSAAVPSVLVRPTFGMGSSAWAAASPAVAVVVSVDRRAESLIRADFDSGVESFAFAGIAGATGTVTQTNDQSFSGEFSITLEGLVPTASSLVAARRGLGTLLAPFTRYRVKSRVYIEEIDPGVFSSAQVSVTHGGDGSAQVFPSVAINRGIVGAWQDLTFEFVTGSNPDALGPYIEGARFTSTLGVSGTVHAHIDLVELDVLNGIGFRAQTPNVWVPIAAPAQASGWSAAPPMVQVVQVGAPASSAWASVTPQVHLRYTSVGASAGWTARAPAVTILAAPPGAASGWDAAPAVIIGQVAGIAAPPAASGWQAQAPAVTIRQLASPASLGLSAVPPSVALVVLLASATNGWQASGATVTLRASAPLAPSAWQAVAPTLTLPGQLLLAPAGQIGWSASAAAVAVRLELTAAEAAFEAWPPGFVLGDVASQVGMLDFSIGEPVLVAVAGLDPAGPPEPSQGTTWGLDTYTPGGIDPP